MPPACSLFCPLVSLSSDRACKEQHAACAGRAVGAALPQLPRLILTQVCESCTQRPWEQAGQELEPPLLSGSTKQSCQEHCAQCQDFTPTQEMRDAQGHPTLAGKSGGVIRTKGNTVRAALFLENALNFFRVNFVFNPCLRKCECIEA